MPRTPSLRRHGPKARAVVTLNGHDHYLGSWPASQENPSSEVSAAYHRLIAEWEARGRRPPEDGAAAARRCAPADLTVNELILAFWKHAELYYRRPDGTHTSELNDYRLSFRPLRKLYGSLPAAELSPLKLKAVRMHMVKQEDLCRRVTNARIARVVRVWKWAVAEELVPESVYGALRAVPGLKEGRSDARESPPVLPVDTAIVEATLPYLLPTVAAMVKVQLFTGARPGEVCDMKPGEIDQAGAIWIYRPSTHKMSYRGKSRAIALGPKAQEVLRPFLEGRDPDACLFSPREAMEAFRASQRKARKTKVQPSQVGRRGKKGPRRRFRERYKVTTYNYAVSRACRKAGLPHWHVHQLRHTYATEVRRQFGLESAQVALGHAQASITQLYAERDLTLAAKVAAEIG